MKDDEYTYRTIPSVNEADRSISVQTEISEGTSLWFSIHDKEKVTAGLDRMADHIKQELGGNQPKLVLHFDCTARGKAMCPNQEKLRNLYQFRQAVGPEAQWAGSYTSGEIGPVGEHNCYHNYTAVVLAVS
jgi:small ligand-binding sensory domain FIST